MPDAEFEFWLVDPANEDEPWADIWLDCLDGYGLELPPPPAQPEWHPCASKSEAWVQAILAQDLPAVRALFDLPADLLRWRANEFTCGYVVGFTLYESALHLAFGTLNLELLEHLFAVSPVRFVQLMGMTNTEEHMGEGAGLPLAYAVGLVFCCELTGQRLPGAVAERETGLPAVMRWLCEKGLMTPTLAGFCFPDSDGLDQGVSQEVDGSRCIYPNCYARSKLPAAALEALTRWENLGLAKQRALTLGTLAEVMPAVHRRLPWRLERLLWVGQRDKGSLLHRLSTGVARLVVGAAGGPCWLRRAAAEVRAQLVESAA